MSKPFSPSSSRRMFLRGACGASLAIPFLPSLLSPSQAAAQVGSAPCFVGVSSIYGAFQQNWAVDMSGETQVAPQTWAKPLTEVSGPISRTLGAPFDALREKMAVFHGLDGTSDGGHNHCFPFTGSSHSGGSDAPDTVPQHPYSIDTVLERAPEFYGDAPLPVPVLRSAPAFRDYRDEPQEPYAGISWWTDESGASSTIPFSRDARGLFSSIFTGSSEPMVDPNARRIRAMDRVLADYRRLESNARLGREDRERLQNYAQHIQALSTRLMNTATVSCDGPSQRNTTGGLLSGVYSNHIDIIVAALACGATRIAMLHIPDHDDTDESQSVYHGHSHGVDRGDHGGTSTEARDFMLGANRWVAARVAELLTKLDGVNVGDGTLLDQSAVLWSNELGGAQHHTNIGTPVVTAGSAGGKLRTNVAIDYRLRPLAQWAGRDDFPPIGRPYNHMLNTIFDAMGVARENWEKQGQGFGDFSGQTNSYTDGAYEPHLGQERSFLPHFHIG